MTSQILVIEDNPESAHVVTWILEDEGYIVTSASSGEKGLALLDEKTFDLVIMDISLPGISGREATRRIRQNAQTAELPILALTAMESEHDSIWASGINDLLTKPFSDDILLAAIHKFIV